MRPSPDKSTWGQLALETAHRAALYSKKAMEASGDPSGETVEDGLCSFKALTDLREKPEPEPREWWWVYAPLLHKLLDQRDESQSRAVLIGLGNHMGVGGAEPRRHWLNFVPASFDTSKISEASTKESQILALIGFNADRDQVNEFSNNVKTSTQIVDTFSQNGSRLLRPLVVDFTESGVLDENDWATVLCAKGYCTDVDSELLRVSFSIQPNENGWIKYTKNLWENLRNKRTAYVTSLEARRPNQLPSTNGELNLCVWLSDILRRFRDAEGPCTCPGERDPSLVFTVPGWLPAKERGDLSGTITVYACNDWLTKENISNELADFISAYHSGSMSFIARLERQRHLQVERAAHVFDLVRGPLDELTDALEKLQRNAQEIRSTLYDPSTALFQSYRQIAPFFEDGTLEYGDCLLKVEHEPKSYLKERKTSQHPTLIDREWPLMAQMMAAALLCRILGRDEELRKAKSPQGLVSRARGILNDVMGETRFDDLMAGLAWIKTKFTSMRAAELLDVLDSKEEAVEFLDEVKAAVFTPFKIDSEKWPVSALKLVLLGMGPSADGRPGNPTFEPADFSGSLVKRPDAVPLMYNTLLEFVHKVMLVFRRQNPNSWLDRVRLSLLDRHLLIDLITLPVSTTYCKDYEQASSLREHVAQVLQAPRAWRIEGANEGDFRAPYVNVAARLLSITTRDETGMWSIESNLSPANAAEPGLYDVFAVKNGERRFKIAIGVKNGDGVAIRICMSSD